MTGPDSQIQKTSQNYSHPAYREVWTVNEVDNAIRVSWPQAEGSSLCVTPVLNSGKYFRPSAGRPLVFFQSAIYYNSGLSFTGDYECSVRNRSHAATDTPCEAVSCSPPSWREYANYTLTEACI